MSLIIDGALLPCDYVIALYVVDEHKIGSVLKMFRNHGTLYHRGMGFILSRVCRNDNRAWLYAVQIWERLRFYVVVTPRGEGGFSLQESAA